MFSVPLVLTHGLFTDISAQWLT